MYYKYLCKLYIYFEGVQVYGRRALPPPRLPGVWTTPHTPDKRLKELGKIIGRITSEYTDEGLQKGTGLAANADWVPYQCYHLMEFGGKARNVPRHGFI